MVVLDVEHPPAAGTALGVALQGTAANLPAIAVAVVTSAALLAVTHLLLRKHLRDLV
jgi:hypothetical protein